MKRFVRHLIPSLVVLAFLSACAGGIRSGTFVISNDTNAELSIIIVDEDGDQTNEIIGANGSYTQELAFGLFDGSQSVTVTFSGLYKAEGTLGVEAYAGEETTMSIDADRGASNFQNDASNGAEAINVWLVPNDPDTYNTGTYSTTVAGIEAAAVSKATNVGFTGSAIATSMPGTYYLMWEDSADIWWYVADPTFLITVNQTTNISF